MPLYSFDLNRMRGSVKQVKPNASKEAIDESLNKRIAKLYDRHFWSDSLRIGTIPINQAYSTGTVNMSQASDLVTGTGTVWPINDRVNTTLSAAIVERGVQDVAPGSMENINPGTYLLIDQEGGPPLTEVVVVLRTTATTFQARFASFHNINATIQSSSLAGRQFKAQFPVYTVKAVLSDTQLQLDNLWGGQPTTGLLYNIYDGYVSVTPNTRRLMFGYDPVAPNILDIWSSQEDLSVLDPQRTASDNPLKLVQMAPSKAGIAQWEIWPIQLSDYMLSVVTMEQWPEMLEDADVPPWFINSNVITAGARADVLRIKNISRDNGRDPYHDPALAKVYEDEFEQGYEEAVQTDQGRAATFLSSYIKSTVGEASYNYWRDHIPWVSDF